MTDATSIQIGDTVTIAVNVDNVFRRGDEIYCYVAEFNGLRFRIYPEQVETHTTAQKESAK